MTQQAPPLIAIDTATINALLDAQRRRLNLSSDLKLAWYLGVSDQAIYRWRRGEIDKSARIMARLAIDLSADIDAHVEIAA